ncbi:MAG: hypothetical protein HQK49_12010 [Oligoflexia bacterium]|nr:hypothetical protein [Oligoflexia bacterium]
MNKKNFDCVEMKNQIQKKLSEEKKKYTKDEWDKRREERFLNDPIMSKVWKNAKKDRLKK